MDRQTIYELIAKERSAQDRRWTDRTQYTQSAPHILLLEEKLTRMRTLWYQSEEDGLHAEFVKVAALAVRALEEIDNPENTL